MAAGDGSGGRQRGLGFPPFVVLSGLRFRKAPLFESPRGLLELAALPTYSRYSTPAYWVVLGTVLVIGVIAAGGALLEWRQRRASR